MTLGRRTRQRATTAMLTLLLAATAAPATGSARAAGEALLVNDIVVAADYDTSHVVYATGAAMGCRTSCARLLRSDDGGASWTPAAARGWPGGMVASVPAGSGEVLVSGTDSAVGTLPGRGASFETATEAGGSVSAVPVAGGVEAAVVNGGNVVTVRLPAKAVARHPAPALGKNASVLLGLAYPAARGKAPAAFVAGSDPVSGMPAIARCDAMFACEKPVLVPNDRKDVARVFASPHVDRDGVVAALPTNGALSVSTDGGKSFRPVTVRPLVPGDVTVAVQDIAFTRDFDLAARKGSAYAAVLAVHKDANERGSTSGAVYRSSDLRTWEKVGAASSLDAGATAVAVAPDGRVFASYLDIKTKAGGVLCTTGTSWGACPAYRAAAGPAGTGIARPATPAPGSGAPAPSGSAPARESSAPDGAGAPGGAAGGGAIASRSPGRDSAATPWVLGLLAAAGAGTAFVRRRTRVQTRSGNGAG